MHPTESSEYDRYTLAQTLYEDRYYSRVVELLTDVEDDETSALSIRLLLARALYGTAQLGRAEKVLVSVVETHPTEAYAHLLLARTLQRQSRHKEAETHLRLAEVMTPGIGEPPPSERS